MKDFDINIKNASEVTLFGTKDHTMVVPDQVKFDSDRNRADIDIKDLASVKIGIPEQAEKVELNIADSKIFVSGLTFERLEIDAKGSIAIDIDGTRGPVDINMVEGSAELIVHKGFRFCTRIKGSNNAIECDLAEDHNSENVIEINGKNSILKITCAE